MVSLRGGRNCPGGGPRPANRGESEAATDTSGGIDAAAAFFLFSLFLLFSPDVSLALTHKLTLTPAPLPSHTHTHGNPRQTSAVVGGRRKRRVSFPKGKKAGGGSGFFFFPWRKEPSRLFDTRCSIPLRNHFPFCIRFHSSCASLEPPSDHSNEGLVFSGRRQSEGLEAAERPTKS